MSEEDLRQAWERGEPIEADRVRRSPTSVVSLRLPDTIMRSLSERAHAEGKAIGTLSRELLETALAGGSAVTPPSLANMFTRWVREAMSPVTAPTVNLVFTSRSISDRCWLSFESSLVPRDNFYFAATGVRSLGLEDLVLTSRTEEVQTEPAGENAA